jgi:hypothetical protein
MDFFDAHFHIWDLSEDTLSGHDASILFAPGGDPVYTVERYENEFTALPKGLVHTGGVRLVLVPCSALSHSARSPTPICPCAMPRAFVTSCSRMAMANCLNCQVIRERSLVWLVHAHTHAHTHMHFHCSSGSVTAWQDMTCILLAAHTSVAHALCTCAHW